MDDDTRRINRPWYDMDDNAPDDDRTQRLPVAGRDDAGNESTARDTRGESTPTDELELPHVAPTTPIARSDASFDETTRLEVPDDRDSTDPQPATRRFETLPETAPAYAPAPAPAAQPHRAPQPAPARAPQHPAPARPPRPVGPNGFARFGAIVLALVLALPGVVLVAYGVTVAIVLGAGEAMGADVSAMPGAGLQLLLIIGGAVFLLLAALTARMSGAGVAITGVLLAIGGLVALIWPASIGDWIVGQPWFPQIGAEGEGVEGQVLSGVVTGVTTFATTLLGSTALVVGAVFGAAAGAVHGARGAGWDRGRGI